MAQAGTNGWDLEADVVMIGAGAAGLPAAIKARDGGASVIVVETNYDIGGHAIISGGNVPLGGGTSAQKKYGIEDSPDMVFRDLTDWTIVQHNGWPDYRYNDREVMRAFADHCASTYEFLLENGVKFKEIPPDNQGGHSLGNSAPRENHAFWTKGAGLESPNARPGTGVIRPLEDSARAKGVKFLLNYKMTGFVREGQKSGAVLGITAEYTPRIMPGQSTPLKSFRSDGNIDSTKPTMSIRAKKGVIVATGGMTSNVNFRRMFDPRLTEVLTVAGEPYSYQDASGELAAMAIGASLWGLVNQTLENGDQIRTQRVLATKWNYMNWELESPIFPLVRAIGLTLKDWQNLILVNQVGKRFYDETKGDYPHGNVDNDIDPYTPNDYRNNEKIHYHPSKYNFFNAAVAMNEYSEPPEYSAGPIWAIFDADAVARNKWNVEPPHVDPDGYFFSANTLTELAGKIKNEFQAKPMNGEMLRSHRGALQFFRRRRQRRGFRQANAEIQDPEAAILRGLGDAERARHPFRSAHQCQMPSPGHERPGHSRPLSAPAKAPAASTNMAWALHDPGIYLWYERSEGAEQGIGRLNQSALSVTGPGA